MSTDKADSLDDVLVRPSVALNLRTCPQCGKSFHSRRVDHVYCSSACRKRKQRAEQDRPAESMRVLRKVMIASDTVRRLAAFGFIPSNYEQRDAELADALVRLLDFLSSDECAPYFADLLMEIAAALFEA